MVVDLVHTTTRDDLRLDGVYQAPAGPASLGVDAVCLVHGTGSNFYGSTLLAALAERLGQLGCGVLRANTRGHDWISMAVTSKGGRRQGGAYEIVDDCRHDLTAWCDWLTHNAGPRIGLIGHSLGAVKCLYAVHHEPRLVPACVIAVSPPRLSYSTFRDSKSGPEFLETFTRAEQLCQAGEGGTLLEIKLPLPFLITAAGCVEKYGPDERYNVLRFADALPCPTLFTFGGQEVATNMAFSGMPEALAALPANGERACATIAGADHWYTGKRTELLDTIEAWLRRP
jgi:pimeloyl-ACP methyl ester carboxylesterase